MYTHTHVSRNDGSPAMEKPQTDYPHSIVLVNEDGHEWIDPLGWWIPIGEETDEDYERWADLDDNHEPDVYWSGTGELMSDDSYIDYLNGH